MAERLESQRNALRRNQDELEELVKLRTDELAAANRGLREREQSLATTLPLTNEGAAPRADWPIWSRDVAAMISAAAAARARSRAM